MIELKNVTFAYGEKQVLKDFSLKIGEGERVCLFGESGKGKTTLLRLICGLEKAQSGEILGTKEKRFSAVFQEDRLLPHLTVEENVALVGDAKKGKALLCDLGLKEYLHKNISDLSGGMRRRVAIARALNSDYDVLLLDEAFNGLDGERTEKTAELILKETESKTVIMITHSLEQAGLLKTKIVEI